MTQFFVVATEILVYCHHLSIYTGMLTALGIGAMSMNHYKCMPIGLITSIPQ
jgi:hypothetical protein